MRKRLTAFLLVVVLALTGCAKMDVGIVILPDGSGSVTAEVSIDKEAMLEYEKKLYASEGMTFSETVAKEVENSLLQEGYKLVSIDGREYYQTTETQAIKKGELQKAFGSESDASYVTTDTVYLEMNMRSEETLTEISASDLPADAIEFVVTVSLPNAIVSTNGTLDSANPNKASFKVPLDKNTVIFATSKKGVTAASVKQTIKKLNTVKAPKIRKLKANKRKGGSKKATATLKFKRVKGAQKYEIAYSVKKNFKNAQVKTTKKTVCTLKNLKRNKKYYVRVRALKTNYAGVTVYSKWTKKSVRTKK